MIQKKTINEIRERILPKIIDLIKITNNDLKKLQEMIDSKKKILKMAKSVKFTHQNLFKRDGFKIDFFSINHMIYFPVDHLSIKITGFTKMWKNCKKMHITKCSCDNGLGSFGTDHCEIYRLYDLHKHLRSLEDLYSVYKRKLQNLNKKLDELSKFIHKKNLYDVHTEMLYNPYHWKQFWLRLNDKFQSKNGVYSSQCNYNVFGLDEGN